MDVVVFGSGSGTNLEALLAAGKKEENGFSVRAVFTDRLCRCQSIAQSEKIPLLYFSFKKFAGNQKPSEALRRQYDKIVLDLLQKKAEEEGFSIDVLFLAGYMRLVSAPLLEAFPNRILTVHPADLTTLDERGNRYYVGMDSVADALRNGERRTRSTVIFVDSTVDGGKIFVEGPWVEYTEGYPVTKEKIALHQEKQKRESDWPAAVEALRSLSKGGR